MKKVLSVYLFLLLTISCKKDCTSIIGTWEWTQSVGGISTTIDTPETTGEKIIISFSADSIYREYRNNSLIAESKFTLARTQTGRIYLNYQGLMDQFFELQSCNDLILKDYAMDGYDRYFKRKN
jgi:hypothetical protein